MKLLEPSILETLGYMKSRVVMSAMTRNFSPDHKANGDMAKYYEARAKGGAGLILTEGTIIHPSADGYVDVPYMYTQEQAKSWTSVIDPVQAVGTKIFSQLWHCGRISHPDFTGGLPPVSSTGRAAEGVNRQNGKPFGEPRALLENEMPEIYQQFVNAAKLALDAGFDGVQLHMGHGYLVDQFFDARVNNRTDRYGGSVKNRCRFGLELLESVLSEVPAEKIMVRISPSRFMGDIYNWPELEEMVGYLLPEFNNLGLRMLDISCANANYFETSQPVIVLARKYWPHLLLGGASLSIEQAEEEIRQNHLDLVTWGRAFIANPDFVKKLRDDLPLMQFEYDMLEQLT